MADVLVSNGNDCKRVTLQDTFHRWREFAEQFKVFLPKLEQTACHKDIKIGDVKYSLSLEGNDGTNERSLALLDKAVKVEQFVGNNLLRFEVGLLQIHANSEYLSEAQRAALRVAIRVEIQGATARAMVRNSICGGEDLFLWSKTDCLVEECNKLQRTANQAETDLILKAKDDLTYNELANILNLQLNERLHVASVRRYILMLLQGS